MAQNLTKPTDVNVDEFIAGVKDERRRSEAVVLREFMERVSGHPATMWGPSMVGFGTYSYKTRSGQTEESFVVGFSPHTRGKGCLYVKKLATIDLGALEAMIRTAVERSSAAS